MSRELSTLRNGSSSLLTGTGVKLAYMGGANTLQDRLIEVADAVANDAELARIADVSRSAVSQWRKGDVKALKALSAVNIQERTGYSVRWLILGIGPKKVSQKSDSSDLGALTHKSTAKLSKDEEQKLLVVLRAFFDTDDEGRAEIVEAVEAISGNGSAKHRGERTRGTKRGRGGARS